MRGRPKRLRRVTNAPIISGVKPYGKGITLKKDEAIFLLYEEYEALRLSDYEKKNQCDSASVMGVSRPTFTRIYISAREKIAQSFVEGKQLIIEGGKVTFDSEWYCCSQCGALFNLVEENNQNCPICDSNEVAPYNPTDENVTYVNTRKRCGRGQCNRRKNNF